MESYYWLSFVDLEADENLGVCIVKANSPHEAPKIATKLGLNPGGEVGIFPLPEESLKEERIEPNRFYTREEMIRLEYSSIKDHNLTEEQERMLDDFVHWE